MSKRLRTLLICAAAVLLVGGVAAAVLLLPPPQDGGDTLPTQTTAEKEIVILDKMKDSSGAGVKAPVKTFSVQNAAGEYRVAERDDGSLSVDTYADLPADSLLIQLMCTRLSDLRAVATVEKVEQDSAYGFDKPTATVTVTFHDDTEETIQFGNKTPYEDGYYCRLQGKETLYIVEISTAELFAKDGLSLIGKSLIAPPPLKEGDDTSTPQLLRLWLAGRVRPQPISIAVDTKAEHPSLTSVSAFVMTAPYLRAVDSDLVNAMATKMKSLTAADVAAVHPDDEQLAAYGLSDPYSTAAFTLSAVSVSSAEGGGSKAEHYNDREHMILLGNKDAQGRYYALINGLDIVYLLDPESVPWAEYQYIDLTSKLLFLHNITTVSSVTVSENGQDTVYELTHYPEKETRDEQLVVTSAGKTYSTSEFRTLYQLMIGMRRVADPEKDAEAVGTPALQLTLRFTDGSEPTVVSFYPMTASRYLCVTNDGEQTAVSMSKAEDFLTQLHNYQTGKPVTTPF